LGDIDKHTGPYSKEVRHTKKSSSIKDVNDDSERALEPKLKFA